MNRAAILSSLGPSISTQMLFCLNAKASRTGSPIFAGIPYAEKVARRAAGQRQRAARRYTRLAAA